MSRHQPRKPKGVKRGGREALNRPANMRPVALRRTRSSHVRHQILVPTQLNPVGDAAPAPVPGAVIERVKGDLVLLTGGVTVYGPAGDGPSAVAGVWVGEGGQLFPEPVLVITADGRADLAPLHSLFLRRIGVWIAEELDQQAVYYTSHPIDVELLKRAPTDDETAADETERRRLEGMTDEEREALLLAGESGKAYVLVLPPWSSRDEVGGRTMTVTLVPHELIEKYEPRLMSDAREQFRPDSPEGPMFKWITMEGEVGDDWQEYNRSRD